MLTKIIKCSANWCAPCKAMEPIFKNAEEKYGKDIEFVKINVDTASGLDYDFIVNHNVRSIPTIFFIDESGEVIQTVVGYTNKLNEIISNLIQEKNKE